MLAFPVFCLSQSKVDTLKFDKVKFVAAGVTCSMCSKAIHENLSSDKSITQIYPNLQTQEWFVDYPKGKYDQEKLKQQVANAGFSVSKIWLNGRLVYEQKKSKKR